MNVLLTGASGFIGSYVVRHLLDRGCRVAVLLRSQSRTWRIENVVDRVIRIEGDLSDVAAIEPALAAFKPELVFHLAWNGVRGAERNNPSQLYNLQFTVDLLNAAIRCGARHFIGLGSQAEYGPVDGKIAEDARTRPTTLYGATKLSTYLLSKQISTLAGIRFAWLRLFSSYGPRDDSTWLIPSTILALLRGKRPALTKGEQLWDYVHADDVAAAICAVAFTPSASGVFNVGSGETETIGRIVERTRDLVAPGAALGFGEVEYRPDQVMYLQADIGRLTSITGWRPKVTLADGLRQTVEWFREQCDRYPPARETTARGRVENDA